MLTPFGRALRKHRIDAAMSLREMAEKIKMAPSFVSAVENGRKSIPDTFIDKVSEALGLDLITKSELTHLAELSQREVVINTANKTDRDRELVAVFARQFGGLGDHEKRQIMSILKGEGSE